MTTVLVERCQAQANSRGHYERTEWIRSLSESDLIALVPAQSGLHFVDCPNCNQGRQENQLDWSPSEPDSIHCRFCQHRFPSAQYKENGVVEVQDPLGGEARFTYWEDKSGYRHFFEAKRHELIRGYLADKTLELARLYRETDESAIGRRAVLLLNRFAELFPSWCFHYDYPFQQKRIYSGPVTPDKYRSGFRTARWTWWAYSDIPTPLVEAFSLLKESEALREVSREKQIDVRLRIENNLIRNAAEQVMANEDLLTNMSPTAWRGLIRAGGAIDEPRYIREPLERLQKLIETKFFYDGFWSEGSPDYGWQSLRGLEETLRLAELQKDGSLERDAQAASRKSLDLATKALLLMRLPDGRAVPVHDSWSSSQRGELERSDPFLLPALGHACLASGHGKQQEQLHFTWSGGYGHSHADNLSILLFAGGAESLSDIGYTHTAYRCWTIATAAHNTVVIDGKNQSLGNIQSPSDGSLKLYDVSDLNAQIVKASGARGYPSIADLYERTLLKIAIDPMSSYYVDCFDVVGGTTHDYFLHGNADQDTVIQTDLTLQSQSSLLKDPSQWIAPRNEGDTKQITEPFYAYGFLKNIKGAAVHEDRVQFTIAPTGGAAAKLRITLFPESNSEVYFGDSPSVRRADENDADLEKFRRSFAMLRHISSGRSRFVAVIEPFIDIPKLDVYCQRSNEGLVKVFSKSKDRTDLIVFGDRSQKVETTLPAGSASFQGDIGLLSSSNPTGKIQFAKAVEGKWSYPGQNFTSASNPNFSGKLLKMDKCIVIERTQDHLPAVGSIIRIITEDGWVYPLTVEDAVIQDNNLRISTTQPVRFHFDSINKELSLLSFPQQRHKGAVEVHWTAGN